MESFPGPLSSPVGDMVDDEVEDRDDMGGEEDGKENKEKGETVVYLYLDKAFLSRFIYGPGKGLDPFRADFFSEP